jgi:hypothetical protein
MTLEGTARPRWAATEGLTFPLGPTRIEEEGAYNFALYSKHAESVTLLLYTASDIVYLVLAYRFDYLKNKTGRIWPCLRLDSSVWTTDKDGIVPALLSGEITARMGRDPGEIYRELTREFGEPAYDRVEAPATPAQKEMLSKLSPQQLRSTDLAGGAAAM